ncbi:hypothetical protein PCASD_06697 [Puccinia coronata f. sp. avenae]|uniref:Uncharacterized protein n=1 Tax=Puccinia coronata f. sp. avenae TaxID=200324 RepID=A0A2N5TF69_9BASI|nr:hypothetical protein PCASD_06697 [Puccinia coronata f. sp. avenae]
MQRLSRCLFKEPLCRHPVLLDKHQTSSLYQPRRKHEIFRSLPCGPACCPTNSILISQTSSWGQGVPTLLHPIRTLLILRWNTPQDSSTNGVNDVSCAEPSESRRICFAHSFIIPSFFHFDHLFFLRLLPISCGTIFSKLLLCKLELAIVAAVCSIRPN